LALKRAEGRRKREEVYDGRRKREEIPSHY